MASIASFVRVKWNAKRDAPRAKQLKALYTRVLYTYYTIISFRANIAIN